MKVFAKCLKAMVYIKTCLATSPIEDDRQKEYRTFFMKIFSECLKAMLYIKTCLASNQYSEVTVLNPSDLLGKEKTCFLQKRYVRVID
jgi:hypothetical protein